MKQLNVGRVRIKETPLPNSQDLWNFVLIELKRQNHPMAIKWQTTSQSSNGSRTNNE
jgi:hypothetical protein